MKKYCKCWEYFLEKYDKQKDFSDALYKNLVEDFNKKEFDKALESFNKRNRRFGGINYEEKTN